MWEGGTLFWDFTVYYDFMISFRDYTLIINKFMLSSGAEGLMVVTI